MAMKRRFLLTVIGVLFLVLAITGPALAFDKVRFAVISDPIFPSPSRKESATGSNLGSKR